MHRILLIIVLFAVAWAIPPVRERIGSSALPVLEKLGPVGDVVVTPIRGYTAKSQASHLLRLIENDYNEGREVPNARTFQQWVRQRAPNTPAEDPWGQPYWLLRGSGTLTVGSSGADGTRNTPDDVKHTVPF